MKKDRKKPPHSAFSNAVWIYRKQWRYAKGLFVLTFLMIPVGLALQFLGIYLPKAAVQEAMAEASVQHIVLRLGMIVGAMMLLSMLQTGKNTLNFGLCNLFRAGMISEMAQKAVSADYQNLEDPKFRDMQTRADNTLWANGEFSQITYMASSAADLIQYVLGYFLFGSVIAFANPWIAVLLTFTPLVNYFFNRRYQRFEYANRENWTPIDRKISYIVRKSNDFSCAKDVRIYGLNDWLLTLYRKLVKQRLVWDRKLLRQSMIPAAADLIVILLRDGIAYYLLISMVLRQELSVDSFILCFAAVGSFAGFVGGIFGKWNDIHSHSLSICDLRDFLCYPDKTNRGEGIAIAQVARPCELCAEHVFFRYEGVEEDTLKDISLRIRPGEKLAIVGLNGAGKTTLVKVLCGLYTPTGGSVTLDGREIGAYNIFDYHSLFSTVFQDFYPLPVSIAQNVSAKEREETDDRRVTECLRLAGLERKIASLEKGIDTRLNKQLNDDGIELSGGEKQKLMLARAIYKDAPILILDEPTAALDPIAENEMYLRYHELTRGRTAVYISHRLSSTRFCDRIIFLENGRIVEEGSHDALMRQNGKYAELFALQSHYYQEGETGNEL